MKKLFVFMLLAGSLSVKAAEIQLDFVFADNNTGAEAVGFIVVDDAFLINPTSGGPVLRGFGEGYYEFPDPAIVDLQFTVTGSDTSNGDYSLNDYSAMVFQTNGGTLDLLIQLIGQATNDDDWGTSYSGLAGDFNLFADNLNERQLNNGDYSGIFGGVVPNGCNFFTLCTLGDTMVLQSISGGPQGSPQPVPAINALGLLTLMSILLGVTAVFRHRFSV